MSGWQVLKYFGRGWAILTDEDRFIDPALIEQVLVVRLPEDPHLSWALLAARARFPQALLTVITLEEEAAPDGADPLTEWVRLPRRGYLRALLRLLGRWRHEQLSALLLLSLHPATVAAACWWFGCNRLLFNRWGQWFFLRRRTAVEWLTGRPGADRGDRGWDWSTPRVRRAQLVLGLLRRVLALPLWLWRAADVAVYVLLRLAWIGLRRLAHRLHPTTGAARHAG